MTKQDIDMESAVCDVADMAKLAVEFIGQTLRFDEKEPPKLVPDEARLLMFALYQTQEKANRVKALFYGDREA